MGREQPFRNKVYYTRMRKGHVSGFSSSTSRTAVRFIHHGLRCLVRYFSQLDMCKESVVFPAPQFVMPMSQPVSASKIAPPLCPPAMGWELARTVPRESELVRVMEPG